MYKLTPQNLLDLHNHLNSSRSRWLLLQITYRKPGLELLPAFPVEDYLNYLLPLRNMKNWDSIQEDYFQLHIPAYESQTA